MYCEKSIDKRIALHYVITISLAPQYEYSVLSDVQIQYVQKYEYKLFSHLHLNILVCLFSHLCVSFLLYLLPQYLLNFGLRIKKPKLTNVENNSRPVVLHSYYCT